MIKLLTHFFDSTLMIMRTQSLLAAVMLCSLLHTVSTAGDIVGTFESTIGNRADNLTLNLECETEFRCKLTTTSQAQERPVTDVRILNNVQAVEKLDEAAFALKYAVEKRTVRSASSEYAEMMRKLAPVLASNPSLAKCWDLYYPTQTYTLACTLVDVPAGSPSLFLFFSLMASCSDVFCRYVIYPLSQVR